MLVDTLIEKAPRWFAAGDGPLMACHLTLVRNLSNFPFSSRASNAERGNVEERVHTALDSLNLLSSGQYLRLDEMDEVERRFLAERRLITQDAAEAQGPASVFVEDGQSLSIMVNGAEHLCMRATYAGQHLQEAWNRLNLMDDTLEGALDFAFDTRLGYLTADLSMLGSGLRGALVLHLPGLTLTEGFDKLKEELNWQHTALHGIRPGGGGQRRKRPSPQKLSEGALPHQLQVEPVHEQAILSDVAGPLRSPVEEAVGSLYVLTNQRTLGVSEEEVIFSLRHVGGEIVKAEWEARQQLVEYSSRGLEDHVHRAKAIASQARLLPFAESLQVLSAVRLGLSLEMLSTPAMAELSALTISAQAAHLEMMKGQQCDPMLLNMERADLFRSRFA